MQSELATTALGDVASWPRKKEKEGSKRADGANQERWSTVNQYLGQGFPFLQAQVNGNYSTSGAQGSIAPVGNRL